MPTNHGVFKHEAAGVNPGFRCGIGQIFQALSEGPFLSGTERESASGLSRHFFNLSPRLLYATQHFNLLTQDLARPFSSWPPPDLSFVQLMVEAGCMADLVLAYLGMFVDDVGQMIPLAVGYPCAADVVILHAASSETLSKTWKLRVKREARRPLCLVGISTMTRSMAALKSAKLA